MTIFRRVMIACLVAVAALPMTAQQAQPEPPKPEWQQIPTPPLPPFHPQEPKRIQLKNGMVIFLQEDHELPLIDGTMRIRGGGRDTPASKSGVMSIYGESWRTGGSKSRTGDQLDDFLEARAAKVETGGGVDSTNISFSCLKGDFDDVFAVFVDLLHNPEFREDKIDLAKDQVNTAISRRNDQIGSIASRESTKLAYGTENPYARQAEYATVASVTRQDLLDFHKKHVQPNNIILGITGDFDSKALEATLRKAFDAWARGPAYKQTPAEFKGAKPGVYFVAKEDVNQSAIRMMYPVNVTRRSPDYFAIEVMNEVLGGGFASRLMTNVRSKKGLAYAVGGGLGVPFDHPGILRLSLGTKSQTTVEGTQALKEEMVGMLQHPPTDEELKRAKDDILNAFIFNFDSKAKVMRERMAYEFYGYPADFLEQYRSGIEKVTTADVARMAQKYLHPDQLAVLVVGNDKDFDKPLASLGPVTTIDITIPPPPGEESAQPAGAAGSAAPASSNAEGKALIARVVEGMGGAAKLDTVKAFRQTATMTMQSPQGPTEMEYESIVVPPDHSRTTMQTPMGEITMVLGPNVAFMQSGDSTQEMPQQQRENVANSNKRDFINIAQHRDDPKYNFVAGGTEKIGSVEARIVEIDADGARARWFVDPQTGHVLRAIFERNTPSGPVQTTADYSDWRTVNGITLPFKRTLTEGGKVGGGAEIKEFVVNPAVDPKLFEKPPASAQK
ncbi:MAG: insulinase family protein [Acidobacteriia bacterium]|nr:insulinase family protein [Terriglobia bacterium]